MTDLLYVSYDKNEKTGETGIVVGRDLGNGEHAILKMELDDKADVLYQVLTNQSVKIKEVSY